MPNAPNKTTIKELMHVRAVATYGSMKEGDVGIVVHVYRDAPDPGWLEVKFPSGHIITCQLGEDVVEVQDAGGT